MAPTITLEWPEYGQDQIILDAKHENWTLKDAEGLLKEKYEEKIFKAYEDHTNFIADINRQPLTFSVMTSKGREPLPIGTLLQSIIKKYGDSPTIYWIPDVTVASEYNFCFHKDVEALKKWMSDEFKIASDKFKCVVPEMIYGGGVRFLIFTSDKDEPLVERLLEITPGPQYPGSEPVVKCVPEFTKDACWTSGKLGYAKSRSSDMSKWQIMVDTHGSAYALKCLVNWLVSKYKMNF